MTWEVDEKGAHPSRHAGNMQVNGKLRVSAISWYKPPVKGQLVPQLVPQLLSVKISMCL